MSVRNVEMSVVFRLLQRYIFQAFGALMDCIPTCLQQLCYMCTFFDAIVSDLEIAIASPNFASF